MGNCLVTKLKGSVDRKDLPKFGFTRFQIETRFSNSAFYLKSKTESVEWFSYDSNYNVIGHQITSPNSAIAYTSGEAQRRILDISKVESIDEITGTGVSTQSGDLSFLQTLSDGRFPNITQISITWSGGLVGNIKDLFSKFIKLENLNITGNNNMSGSMESLLETLFAAGKASGTTLDITANTTGVTLNDSTVNGTYNVEFNSTGCTVSLNGSIVRTYSNGVWS